MCRKPAAQYNGDQCCPHIILPKLSGSLLRFLQYSFCFFRICLKHLKPPADDLLVAVKKKWAEEEEREAYGADYEDEDDYGEAFEEPEEIEEDEEEFSEMELPEIDMSAVLEVEEKAAKEKTKKKAKAAEPEAAQLFSRKRPIRICSVPT